MIWGDETPGHTDLFEVRPLADARYRDEEHSLLYGVGAAAPEENAREEAAGLVDVAASTGNSAWRRRLAPHHREAVKTFFAPRNALEARGDERR